MKLEKYQQGMVMIIQLVVYWNSYETKPAKVIEQGNNIYELLDASFRGVKRLFAIASFVAAPAMAGGNTDDTAGIKNNKK